MVRAQMRQIAPDVFHLPLVPRNAVNAYLVGDVLVDTGMRTSAGRLLEAVKGRSLRAIALTHAHGDHGGSARKLAKELDLPVWVGAADRAATETGTAVKKAPFDRPGINVVAGLLGDFPGVPVARDLREGDELAAGFTVLDTPGHSPGHISLWRESDRVLLCGDVFFNMHLFTTVPGLRQPPGPFTCDPPLNRESERKVTRLEPRVAGFGHGPVIEGDAAEQLASFVATLPQ
jgi:glyoxylase-like metal-dependent hydrolase (beta-lactamase superfamily II)